MPDPLRAIKRARSLPPHLLGVGESSAFKKQVPGIENGAWAPRWQQRAPMLAGACCSAAMPTATQTQPHKIITGLEAYKGTDALASGILSVQGKLAFGGAKAICNADPAKKGATHRPHSGLRCQPARYLTGCTPSDALRSQGSSQPGSSKIQRHHVLASSPTQALSTSWAAGAVIPAGITQRHQAQRGPRDGWGHACRARSWF